MAIIEPVRTDVQHPNRVKRYSASLRIWHWLNFVVITGSLVTVLLNSTLTNKHTMAAVIKSELQDSKATLSDGQISSVAHALSDRTWDVHTYFGYCLAALLLFRLILEFFQLADQKMIRKIKTAYNQFHVIKKNREVARHEFTVKMIYLAFYILLIVMVITGMFLAFEDALVKFKSIRHSVKEVHGFCMYLILAFITVHIVGVLLAEKKTEQGIVSDMINGGDQTRQW